MKKPIMLILITFIFLFCSASPCFAEAPAKAPAGPNPVMIVSTNLGDITLELNQEKAPISVNNFLDYADSGFYEGTIFHRVIPNFMIQGGGVTQDMQRKVPKDPIKNEAKNGLKNIRGSIAMARTPLVNSATSQFFINLKDNSFLDHGVRDYGYAVFGRVIGGMDVVDKIAAVGTTIREGQPNVPSEPVVIKSVKRKAAAAAAPKKQ